MRSRLTAWVLVGCLGSLSVCEDTSSQQSESLLTELNRLHQSIEMERNKIAERRAVVSDNKSKWTSIPTEFLQFAWKDPQSFYMGVSAGALEMIVYAIAWRRMRMNVAVWNHEIATLKDLATNSFDFKSVGEAGSKPTKFVDLYKDWIRAEKGLAAALTQLSKDELDVWLQSDRISSSVRGKALKLGADIASGVDSPGDATSGRPTIERAMELHSNAYENLRSAMETQRVGEIVKAASRRQIPHPKSTDAIFKDAGGIVDYLPVGEGQTIKIGSTPGARALHLELTLSAIRNVKSSAARSITRTGKYWRRASLPALLLAIPVTSIAISRYYDAQLAQETRLEQGEAVRQKHREVYISTMADLLPKPLLSMFIAAWRSHPRLRFYQCPFAMEKNGQTFQNGLQQASLQIVSGVALLSLLELESEGKSLGLRERGKDLLSDEFLERFFTKMVSLSRKENPGLDRIPLERWEEEIIPDLVVSGGQLFGQLPVAESRVAEPQSQQPQETDEIYESNGESNGENNGESNGESKGFNFVPKK